MTAELREHLEDPVRLREVSSPGDGTERAGGGVVSGTVDRERLTDPVPLRVTLAEVAAVLSMTLVPLPRAVADSEETAEPEPCTVRAEPVRTESDHG
jgi:hypothetical protein